MIHLKRIISVSLYPLQIIRQRTALTTNLLISNGHHRRLQSTKTENNNVEDDSKPIQYTKSKAFRYKAYENFREIENEESTVPPYNNIAIKLSFAIFLIYFLALREPNDIDDLLSRDLFEIVPELEIPMLEADMKRLEQQGINVDDLKQKLNELKRLEKEKEKQS
ncbi:hypothetical protein HUG17_6332 [Dermatophagoides farinae]|uniref:Uncharacterized protein n=1 Tax=Dermatophagoides farinae TaxID=6954 RepID=A0A9D4P6G8_DERFA|nr:uncharacterized protein LOC124494004 [Dermatophagoides farinae]KAH7643970.1 hypothetical protein HUG17_6332 [Dermatophagoides farinae]